MQFHLLNSADYNLFRSLLNEIEYDLGKQLDFNRTRDERGLTDNLIDGIVRIERAFSGRTKNSELRLNIEVRKPSEKYTGSDILFRVQVQSDSFQFDRYILIQAKKYLYDKKRFSQTNSGNEHLTGQIEKMQKYNAEFSYLLFYSPINVPSGNCVGETLDISHYDPELIYFLSRGRIRGFPGRSIAVTALEGSSPITLVRSNNWIGSRATSSRHLLSISEPFSDLILDNLICGRIGKEWDSQIEKASGEFGFEINLKIRQGG